MIMKKLQQQQAENLKKKKKNREVYKTADEKVTQKNENSNVKYFI